MSIFRARAERPRLGFTLLARTRLIATTSLIGAVSVLTPGAAHAQSQPTNGMVEAGSATIDQTSLTNTIVDLMDTNSVINWDTFDIGAGTSVNFITADNVAAYSVLNRVVTAAPSVIDGDLNSQSNISVWLVNPSGIMFGAAGTFTGGSLVLSTAAVGSTDFLDGDGSFALTNADTAGAINLVSGAGEITASGGMIAVAQDLTSGKTITAGSGEVALIAAQDVTLGFAPGSPIAITVGAGTTIGSARLLANGTVSAQSIKLAAAASAGLVGTLLSVDPGASLTATADGGRVFIGNQSDAASSITIAAATVLETGATIGGSVSASGTAGTVAVRNLGNVDIAGAVAADNGGFIALNGLGNANSLTTTGALTAGASGGTPAIAIAADGAVSVAQLNAANGAVSILSQTAMLGLGTATTGGNLTVSASAGVASVSGAIDAGANYSVTALGVRLGGASAVEQTAKADIMLSAGAQGIATSAGAAALTLTSNTDLDDAAGGGTTSITTTNGGVIDLASNSTLRSLSMMTLVSGVAITSAAAAQLGTVVADSLSVSATSVTANGNITVSNPLSIASGGITQLNDVAITGVGAGAIVTSAGAFSAGQFLANGTVQITGSSITVDTASSAAGGVELTSTAADVVAGTANALVDVVIDAAAGAIVTGNVTAGADYRIDAANITLGTAGAPTLQQAGNDVDFQLTAGGGVISGLGSLRLISNSDGAIAGQTLFGTANGAVDFGANTQLISTNIGAPLSGVSIINGTGSISLGAVTADTLTTSASSASIAALGAVSTINSLNLTSTGVVSLISATTTGAASDIDIAAGGEFTANSLTAAEQITIDAARLNIGSISAIAGAIDVETTSGGLTAGTVNAGTLATLTKAGGTDDLIVTGSVNAGLAPASVGTITITSDVSTRLGTGTAASGIFSTTGAVSISAVNDITGTDAGGGVFNRLWASAGAGSDVSITSSSNGLATLGRVIAQNDVTVLAGQIDALGSEPIEAVGGALTLTATTGNLAIDDARAQGAVSLVSTTGDVAVGTVASTAQSVIATASMGTASIGTATAANDLVYVGQSVALSGTQSAGGKIDVTATAGAITASPATVIRSNTDGIGAEAITLDATGGNIALGNAMLQAGDAIDPSRIGIRLGAGSNDIALGDVSALALVSVAADHVTFDTALSGAGGTVSLGNISTVNTLDISAVGAIATGTIDVTGAGQNLILDATGPSSAIVLRGAATATGALQLGAGAGIAATSLSGTSIDALANTGDVSIATATATAGNGQLRALAGSVRIDTLTVTGGDASIIAGVDIAGQATGTRVTINADDAGRDATFDATGAAFIDTVSAGRNITGTAAAIDAIDATATDGAFMLTAFSGDLSLVRGSAGTTANLTTMSATADLAIGETLIAGTVAGSTGDITVSSGRDFLVSAFDPLVPTSGFVRSLTGSIAAVAGRDVRAIGVSARPTDRGFGAIDAGGTLSLSGAGDIRANRLTSVGNLDVSMVAGSLTGAGPAGSMTGTIVPGGAFFAQSDGQSITVTSGAAGLIQVREVRAANDVTLNADMISAGTIETTTGRVLLNNSAAGAADPAEIYVGLLTSAGNIALTFAGSPATIATTAGGFAFDPAFGQANLSSTGGSVNVAVSRAAQLGTVTSGGPFDVSAAAISLIDANAAGAIALTAMSGGLYLGSATAGTTATLVKQGSPTIDADHGIRVATALQATGATSIMSSTFARLDTVTSLNDTLIAAADGDLTINTGISGTGATLTTTAGDIIINSSLTAATDATLISGNHVRANTIVATTGGLSIAAAGDVTGIAAPSAIASGLRVASLVDSGATMITASTGDIRIGSVANTAGAVGLTATLGSATGLATSGDLVAGPGATLTATAGSIGVTAGGRAALGATSSGTSTSVTAAQISSQNATAGAALGLVASDALSVDNASAAGTTLSTSAGGATAIDLTDANSAINTLSDGFGAANLMASGGGASIVVTAGSGAQIGVLTADADATVNAAAAAVSSITAVNGALSITTGNGGLYLGTGIAGTTATLVKQGGPASDTGDGIRLAGRLQSAGEATITSASFAQLNAVSTTGGNIIVAVGTDLTGLGRASVIDDVLRVRQLTDAGATAVSAVTGDIRIGAIASSGSGIAVGSSQGSVTGLSLADLGAGPGAMLTAAGNITTTGTSGRTALGSVSGVNILVSAQRASIADAIATGTLTATAADALSIETASAAGATLGTTAGGSAIVPLTAAGLIFDGDTGLADLTASSGSVSVTAAKIAQLGVVGAQVGIDVTAAAVSVSNAVATMGTLNLTATTGGLTLGTGLAGTDSRLIKRNGVATTADDEIEIVASLTAGGTARIDSDTHVRAAAVTSSGAIGVRASNGDVNAGTLSAGEDVAIKASNDAVLTTVMAGDDVHLSIGRNLVGGTITSTGTGPDARRIDLDDAGLSFVAAAADRSNIVIEGAADVAIGTAIASASVAALAGGALSVATVTAGEDIAFDAVGPIAIGVATSGDDIVLASNGGILLRDTASALGSGPNTRSIVFTRTTNGLANGGIAFAANDMLGAGSARLITSGPASDIEIGARLDSLGDVTLLSSRDARVNSVRSSTGAVMANVARDLTGISAAAAFGPGTGLRIGTLADGGVTTVAASSGDIRIGSIANTGGDVLVSAGLGSVTGLAIGDIAAGPGAIIAAPLGSVSLVVGGRTALSLGEAGSALTVGSGTISIGSAVAGTSVSLTATGDALSLDSGIAGAGASLQTLGGMSAAIGLTDVAASRDVLTDQFGSAGLSASGTARSITVNVSNPVKAAQLGTVSASRDVTVVGGAIAASSVTAGAGASGGAIAMTAASGSLYVGSAIAGSTIRLVKNDGDADGLLAAQSDRDELRVRQRLVAGGDVSIVSATSNRLAGGSPTARVETTAGSISVSSAGQTTGIGTGASGSTDPAHARADLLAAAAGQDVSVTTGNLAQLGIVSAGRNVTIAAGNSTLRAGAPVNGAIDATAVTANTGALALSARATAPSAGALEDGDIVVQSARAGTTAIVTNGVPGGTAGDIVVGQSLTAAGNIGIASVGSARLAGDDNARQIVSTGGSITVAATRSITGIAGSAAGVTEAGFGRVNLIAEAAGQDVIVTSGAVTQAMTISAGRTIDVRAGSTALGNGAIDIVTANAASGSLLLLAQATNPGGDTVRDGDISLGSVIAGTTATITNTAGLGVPGSALSPMLTGNTGDIVVTGTIAAGQLIAVTAANGATLGGATSQAGNIFIQSNQIALNGAVIANGSASEVRLVNRVDTGTTRVNATILGNGGTANQFVLDNTELGRLGANRVVIETAQQASDIQDVAIGSEGISLAANAGRNRFEVLAVSPNPSTGPNPTIVLNGTLDGGTVVRTIQIGGSGGAFGAAEAAAPLVTSGGMSGRIVAVLTRTGGGRILAPAAHIELRAQRVLFGNEALRAAVIGLAPAQIAIDFVANPNSLLFDALDTFDATDASQIFLRADRLTVRYRDFALFQNTAPRGVNAGIAIGDGTGTGARLSLFSTGAFPSDNAFAFFGTINNLMGRSVGLQSDMVIQFAEPGGSPQRINQNQSRLNGCVLGSPDKGCLTTESPAPALKLFDERQLLLLSAAVVTPLEFDPLVSGNNESLFVDFGAFAVDPSSDGTCESGQGEACPKPEGGQ